MPNTGSTVVRRQLGRRLRRLRDQAHKSERDVEVAKLLGHTKLWRIETGKTSLRIGGVRTLCWFYGTDAETTDALANMALGTLEQNWWEASDLVVPEWLNLYVGLESTASAIRIYEPELVHGLFQTPDYARAVREAFRPDTEPAVTDRIVQVRSQRQQTLFSRMPPPQITAIFAEGVLARSVGGERVTAEQTARLRTLAARDHVDLRVLPWSAGAHAALIGSFAIFDFDDEDDPSVVYVEMQTGARYLEKRTEVTEHRHIFDLVCKQTVPIEEHQP
ncbi:MAG: helix-turn-helix domain-containing protein [Micromonosporaceae bacterium]|nr:helix-turn-helix domain-containing protein [Micromonosporaceae bacterium]